MRYHLLVLICSLCGYGDLEIYYYFFFKSNLDFFFVLVQQLWDETLNFQTFRDGAHINTIEQSSDLDVYFKWLQNKNKEIFCKIVFNGLK